MKWSLQQLHKVQSFPYYFEEILDLSSEIDPVEDIYAIGPVNITGRIYRIDDDSYRFVYKIKVKLVLQCALTLDPVDYEFCEDYDEIYSTIPSDDSILIEKNTIDTAVMAWSNIVIDKPINVTKPDAYEILKSRGISLEDEYEEDGDVVISYTDGRHTEDEDI